MKQNVSGRLTLKGQVSALYIYIQLPIFRGLTEIHLPFLLTNWYGYSVKDSIGTQFIDT